MGWESSKKNWRKKINKKSKFKLGIVVLVRLSSSRLPGKALMEINGKPSLQYTLERVMIVVNKENIVIATSDEAADDPISKFAEKHNVSCFRGSLKNVAERFFLAANEKGWDYAIRINGDSVLLEYKLLNKMIKICYKNNYDFLSNVKGRTYPIGMSIEIVKMDYYKKLLPQIVSNGKYKEHVTLYLYEKGKGNHYYFYNEEIPEAKGMHLALDMHEDFEKISWIINAFHSNHANYGMKEIVEYIKQYNNENPI